VIEAVVDWVYGSLYFCRRLVPIPAFFRSATWIQITMEIIHV